MEVLIVPLGSSVLTIICICIGYWMGRNSIEKPFVTDNQDSIGILKPKEKDDSIPDNIFDFAMQEPGEEDRREPTIRR